MIRPTTLADKCALIALAAETGLFESEQLLELSAMLDQHLAVDAETHDLWFTDDDHGPVGVAYAAPERMTEGTWNLYLIAVHPNRQRQGRGTALLRRIETALADRGQRVLLVETSGLEDFAHVRMFYRTCGFIEEARIREFYKAGDDKVIFRKGLKEN
ncbi:MAG: GNAT family N-acetyltransferase [Planctomycetaceae bacterium]|nr:GNAT family N-acetyltransferase [Planctomycetaceae bacterium]